MKKILLIEDNPEVRENTSEILSLANYQVITAENGKAGVELALQEKPDLIICDIMMPELDGYGVLHILSKKPETASIPFIFLTAKTEKSDIRKGMTLGADDYLTKPFDDTDLLNAVESRLNRVALFKKNYDASTEGLNQLIDDARQVLRLNDLCKDRKVRQFKKKATIFMEGETPNAIFFLQKGNVKTFRTNADGKEFITDLYAAGDFFGYEPILENNTYTESAVALEDSEVIIIPRHDFLTLLHGHPELTRSFVSLLCKKVTEKEAQLLALAYNSVRQRTAEALLKVSHIKESKELSLSRDDLAKMVGTASESVIRVLSDFRDEGIVEIDGSKIKILHPGKLEQVVKWNVARH
ncbi:MAG: response regulator [Cyclobacteriaceae bacterium]|nr:response regulator [Cyclobacteriaceae bacterium]MCX7638291.1 response regulator [Cyclobacteriaceae bacterium]MDW8330191.1 response regulator [Cyclobacteriaceae bacterium]